MRPGTVFVPFHWGDLFGEGNAANYLTVPAFGPVEKQPELKFCAAQVAKVPARRPNRIAVSRDAKRSASALDAAGRGPRSPTRPRDALR